MIYKLFVNHLHIKKLLPLLEYFKGKPLYNPHSHDLFENRTCTSPIVLNACTPWYVNRKIEHHEKLVLINIMPYDNVVEKENSKHWNILRFFKDAWFFLKDLL